MTLVNPSSRSRKEHRSYRFARESIHHLSKSRQISGQSSLDAYRGHSLSSSLWLFPLFIITLDIPPFACCGRVDRAPVSAHFPMAQKRSFRFFIGLHSRFWDCDSWTRTYARDAGSTTCPLPGNPAHVKGRDSVSTTSESPEEVCLRSPPAQGRYGTFVDKVPQNITRAIGTSSFCGVAKVARSVLPSCVHRRLSIRFPLLNLKNGN
jgi:hypothetical protein